MQNILGAINIDNPPSHTAIALDDRSDTAARNMIIGTSPTDSGEGYISGLAPANINYRYIDTSSLTIDTDEVAGNIVNVYENGVTTNLHGHATASVRISDGLAGVQNILARD